MDLYHAEIGLPKGFALPAERVALSWTRHAEKARKDDRYGEIPAFTSLPLSSFSVVEVGMENGRVAKIVVRGRYTKEKDVIFVLIPGKVYTVKTVWINLHSDQHKTLDRSKYVNLQ
jgi:hypothetical protein